MNAETPVIYYWRDSRLVRVTLLTNQVKAISGSVPLATLHVPNLNASLNELVFPFEEEEGSK